MSENFFEATKDMSAEAFMFLLNFSDTRESILAFSQRELIQGFPELNNKN